MNLDHLPPESARLALLLQGVAGKDEHAFRELHALTSSHLHYVAGRLLWRRELVEECVQDAYLSVWDHAASYSPALALPMTWLISVTRNKAVDRLRRDRWETEAPDEERAEEGAATQEEDMTRLLMQRRLSTQLSHLAPAQRQCLSLVYYGGMSHSELAAHLNVPLGTAKAWVRRGLERLREAMQEPALAP